MRLLAQTRNLEISGFTLRVPRNDNPITKQR
jgi:hypothetical protein